MDKTITSVYLIKGLKSKFEPDKEDKSLVLYGRMDGLADIAQQSYPKYLDLMLLNKEIEELIPQWQPERTAGIKIEWELEENLPPAMIDKKQFEYALRNVFFNAVESMESGGRIIIFTQIVDLFLDKAQSTIKNRYVEVRIRDTGCGIPAEFLDKVMLPYFSLNKIEGTGLGLCIVKKIMDSHEGLIDIYSEVNQGTTVTLRFKTKN